ncbi:heavy metal translocating P-type ATPase [Candidatus Albibeggiatoa sp. nov. NOAA]|uniref:heavy metal translocating P-type ATPase n=1 Tax=Candidatus Albibeggiatoa sp. nov. NOAA TaxID=3162724 RepID=UPI0033005131|nr:heavy metal translocating P-type ATPase [Thiotrichaceae bacterium]
MLLAKLGIMFTVYAGVKAYKTCFKLKPQATQQIPDATESDDIQKKIEQKHDHYFAASSVGVGVSIASYAYPPLIPVSVVLVSYTTIPIIDDAIKTLSSEKRIRNDTLTATTGVLAIALNQSFAGAIESWVYHLGDKMVTKTKDTSEKMLTNVFEQQPSKVWILRDGAEIEVDLETVQLDDIVIVNTGMVIPVDGVIKQGMAVIDQQALTGEAVPVERTVGDKVFASTLLVSGSVHLQVEKTGAETTVSKLGDLLNHTSTFKTSLQLEGEKWADRASTPLLALSMVSMPFIGLSSAASILISAPTNTIRILTSMQTLNHLSVMASKGILIKDGRALEESIKVDTVLFDKTGTLTTDQPTVGRIVACADLTEEQVLKYTASVECRLSHPIANAILKEAQHYNIPLFSIEDANYKVGYGLTVSYQDQVIQVGSARFMRAEQIELPEEIVQAQQHADEQGYSLVLLAVDQQIKGALELRPQVRPEVKQVLKTLRNNGIKHIAIVSGDHKQATQKLAESLGIEEYFYEVLPQDKAALVEQLQAQGRRVCFVGDGINDTVAMKQANVSVSLSGASSIATDMAQVVLLDGSLNQFTDIFEISQKLNNSLRNSLLFWIGYGVTNLAAASILRYSLTRSVVIFSGVFGLGVGHAMLPLREMETETIETVVEVAETVI